MCLYPTLLINPKYKPNKKNGGKPPPLTNQAIKHIPAPCGRCQQCRKQTSNSWKIRLTEEVKHDNSGQFITLTFSDKSILELTSELPQYTGYALDNQIATLAVRRFLERIRKKTKKSIKHWLITELGHKGTQNIHLHGILWTQFNNTELTELWQYGYIWTGYDKKPTYINEATVNYITKYITKTDLHNKYYKPKILCSKGIGKAFINTPANQLNKYKKEHTNETYRTSKGNKIALPTYYRNHTYTETEKENLWLQKINQNIRYIGKTKYHMDTQSKQYFAALETAQKENERLGYGTDQLNWNEKQYQETLRDQRNQTRILRALKKQKETTRK